ncbi:MAG: hypothetical protein GY913_19045 [Proteobacteria bacterium]|nr:hypothetical protein [Pseudomonadota bacterium]MCP4919006.1 hypothetical protein [Pseudomonadota bacterium]
MMRHLTPLLLTTVLVGCTPVTDHEDLGKACLGEFAAWDTGPARSSSSGT